MDVVRVDGDDTAAADGLLSIDKTPYDGGDEFAAMKIFVAT